jgi:membrane associated rhomboid family serine protease
MGGQPGAEAEPGASERAKLARSGVQVAQQDHRALEACHQVGKRSDLGTPGLPLRREMGRADPETCSPGDDHSPRLLPAEPRQPHPLDGVEPGRKQSDAVFARASFKCCSEFDGEAGDFRDQAGLIHAPGPRHVAIELLEGDELGSGLDDRRRRSVEVQRRVDPNATMDVERGDGDRAHPLTLAGACATMTRMEPTPPAVNEAEQTYCYAHPKTPTRLSCSRCGRPICGRCAIPATVGQHCPECVAEARRTAPKVRSQMMASAPAVTTILAINVIMFALQKIWPEVTARLVMSPPLVAEGEWWRLLTSMVLHSPTFVFHIVMNSLVLWIYGPHVERAFGTARFVAMYVVAGFLGSAASYAFGNFLGGSLGASGAIFGIAGVLLVYLYKRRTSSFVYAEMRSVMVFVGINLLLGFTIRGIDYWAHLGGLLAGMGLAAGLDHGEAKPARAGAEIGTFIAVIAIGIGLVVFRTTTSQTSPLFGF